MQIIVIGNIETETSVKHLVAWLDENRYAYKIANSLAMQLDYLDALLFVHYSCFSPVSMLDASHSLFLFSIPVGIDALPEAYESVFENASPEEFTLRIARFLKSSINSINSDQSLLSAVFDNATSLMMLVDEFGVVERLNRPKSVYSDEQLDMFISRGKVLDCINATNKNGCGSGTNCKSCDVRTLTELSLKSKRHLVDELCKVTIKNKDGQFEERQVLLTSTYLELQGKPKALMSIVDVTKQKRIEQAVADSNESIALAQKQIEAAAEIGNIAFFEMDVDSLVSRGNKVWLRFLNTDQLDQHFDEWAENIHPEHYKLLMQNLTAVIRGAEYSFEQKFAYSNELLGEFWLHAKLFGTEYAKDGKPGKIIGIAQDITEQVQNEQKIKTQQANQKALLENTEAHIWLVDRNCRIKEMNTQFRRSFKMLFNIHFSLGDSFIDLLPHDYAQRWKALLDKSFLGDSHHFTESIKFQNSERFFETRLTPVWMDDVVVAVSCYLTENTVQKRYEQMLKYARKSAESANTAKSQFLANMSHEIRTPLNAILGFSEILEASEKKPEKKSYLQSIKKSGTMLLSIINDVLDLSKIEAGKVTLKPEFTDIHALLTDTFEPFIFRATQKKLSFATDIADIKDVFINIDGFRFRQILLNLLSNAVKFTESGGVVCNALLQKTGSEMADLIVQISDTGIGIDPEQVDAIFNPFLQQENQDDRKYEGTGLGLSISKQLVELMDGVITVDSKEKSGSLFTVKFANIAIKPRMLIADEPINKTKRRQFKGKLAIVVDDIAEHRQVIGGYLKLYGIKTVYAINGLDLFTHLNSITPDIIFMDIRMPEMNGYEALRKLQTKAYWQKIPTVAVTAEVFANEVAQLKEKGFVGMLRKPLQLNDLHQLLIEMFPSKPDAEEDTITILNAIPDEHVKLELQLQAKLLLKKQPRKDLLHLADSLQACGRNFEIPAIERMANDLRLATNQFNISSIRRIIGILVG